MASGATTSDEVDGGQAVLLQDKVGLVGEVATEDLHVEPSIRGCEW
jgi:hypothetical protein